MKNLVSSRLKAAFAASLIPFLSLSALGKSSSSGYFGMYLSGAKMGYASYKEFKTVLDGKQVKASSSDTVIKAQMLGSDLNMTVFSKTFSTLQGKLIEMDFTTTSHGRTQSLNAYFKGKTVEMDINNSGSKSHKSVPMPSGLVTDDPLGGLVLGEKDTPAAQTVYVLDPSTASFVTTKVSFKGTTKINVSGKQIECKWIQIVDPRATEDAYLDNSGDVQKIVGPLGIEMLPEDQQKAMSGFGDQKVDLAIGSRIVPTIPDGAQIDWQHISSLVIDISANGKLTVPALPGQTVKASGQGIQVTVQPNKFVSPAGVTIAQAEVGQKEWISPDLNIPSDDPSMQKTAKSIIGKTTDVSEAARKIQVWVHQIMTPDASIGVLRDAREILKTRRGVCRDYAVLTACLCRAAGIPAKLVSGLVSWDGDFYYHAWTLFYDGHNWVGLDSVAPEAQMCASHIALADGTFAQAFQFPVLETPKIKVVKFK